jgi:hypothetical protein
MSKLSIFDQHSTGFSAGILFFIRKKRPSKAELFKSGWARRKAECNNTPPWADKQEINRIYTELRRLNKRDGAKTWAVDHIVPLNHPIVCGLHIACNLQIIPYLDNSKKSNLWYPNMPEEQLKLIA